MISNKCVLHEIHKQRLSGKMRGKNRKCIEDKPFACECVPLGFGEMGHHSQEICLVMLRVCKDFLGTWPLSSAAGASCNGLDLCGCPRKVEWVSIGASCMLPSTVSAFSTRPLEAGRPVPGEVECEGQQHPSTKGMVLPLSNKLVPWRTQDSDFPAPRTSFPSCRLSTYTEF